MTLSTCLVADTQPQVEGGDPRHRPPHRLHGEGTPVAVQQGDQRRHVCQPAPSTSGKIKNTEKFIEMGAFSDQLSHSTDYQMFLNLASKYKVDVTQDVCANVRIHGNNLTKQLRIKAANEVIEIVSSFSPNPTAVKALSHHKASLAVAYLREKRIKDFLCSINNPSILKILISRIFSRIKG